MYIASHRDVGLEELHGHVYMYSEWACSGGTAVVHVVSGACSGRSAVVHVYM